MFGIVTKRRTQNEIAVSFSEEMGSQRGSWKGGTIGMNFNMKPGETPRQAIRRMQRETKFR